MVACPPEKYVQLFICFVCVFHLHRMSSIWKPQLITIFIAATWGFHCDLYGRIFGGSASVESAIKCLRYSMRFDEMWKAITQLHFIGWEHFPAPFSSKWFGAFVWGFPYKKGFLIKWKTIEVCLSLWSVINNSLWIMSLMGLGFCD